jgi:hypothetical protein
MSDEGFGVGVFVGIAIFLIIHVCLGGLHNYTLQTQTVVEKEFLNGICQEFSHNEYARVDWEKAPYSFKVNDTLNCIIPLKEKQEIKTQVRIVVKYDNDWWKGCKACEKGACLADECIGDTT